MDEQVTAARAVPVECYSRIVGYIRPVGQWNLAKQVEFSERVMFALPDLPDGGRPAEG